jgi:hypothetical protein
LNSAIWHSLRKGKHRPVDLERKGVLIESDQESNY